jgi:hypothetical protein
VRYRIHIKNGELISCNNPDVEPGKEHHKRPQIPWDQVPDIVKERMAVLDVITPDGTVGKNEPYRRDFGNKYMPSPAYGVVYFIHDTGVPDATVAVES